MFAEGVCIRVPEGHRANGSCYVYVYIFITYIFLGVYVHNILYSKNCL